MVVDFSPGDIPAVLVRKRYPSSQDDVVSSFSDLNRIFNPQCMNCDLEYISETGHKLFTCPN